MFKKNIKKRTIKLTLATIFIFSLFFIISAQSTNAQTGCSGQITGTNRYSICRVNAGETLFIPTQGCSVPSIQVNNNSSKDIFVPTNDCAELSSVIVHLPTNTSATISSGLISGETFTDPRDGQVYPIVEIGSQVWMAKNLAYLPSVTSPGFQPSPDNPYYYVYDYYGTDVNEAKATANYATYGVLYNWPAAMTACPAGWHLPSDAELHTLESYLTATGSCDANRAGAGDLGWGCSPAGTLLKSGGATGFNALLGGAVTYPPGFDYMGSDGYYFSGTLGGATYSYVRVFSTGETRIYRYLFSTRGAASVRCIKDTPVLKNAGFESGNLTWWNTEGDASVSSSYKHSGNYGARVFAQANANQTAISKITQTADLTGKNYLRFFYKYDGSTDCVNQGGTMRIYLKIDGVSTTLLNQGGTCQSPSIGWTERIIDISSYSGVKLIEFESQAIGASMEGSNAQISFMVDDIEILDDISYGVTYDANGGSCTPERRDISPGSAADAPSCSKTWSVVTGYTITSGTCASGWNASTGYCGSVTGPITIRANWWTCGDNWVDPRDGQSYTTKLFSSGCWMTKNLNFATGRICYQNNSANCAIAGGLYRSNDLTKICPADWIVPSQAQYQSLFSELGTSTVWSAPDGWNAQLGGRRQGVIFSKWGMEGHWWSRDFYVVGSTTYRYYFWYISPTTRDMGSSADSSIYLSIRCVRW